MKTNNIDQIKANDLYELENDADFKAKTKRLASAKKHFKKIANDNPKLEGLTLGAYALQFKRSISTILDQDKIKATFEDWSIRFSKDSHKVSTTIVSVNAENKAV
jgi:hypothetical protein